VNGKTVRRTLGKVSGRSLITAAAARALQVDVSSELQQGKSGRLSIERQEARGGHPVMAALRVELVSLDCSVMGT